MLHSHAHWFLQALYVFAVTMNTVAQVGGGAGIFCGAESWHVTVGEGHVLRVERSCAFAPVPVPPLAFAFPDFPLIFIWLWNRRDLKKTLWKLLDGFTWRL